MSSAILQSASNLVFSDINVNQRVEQMKLNGSLESNVVYVKDTYLHLARDCGEIKLEIIPVSVHAWLLDQTRDHSNIRSCVVTRRRWC